MRTAIPEQIMQQIESALYAGNTLAAVKLYHDSTGIGLVESKRAIEEHEGELRLKSPERFASVVKLPPQMGCLLGIAILSMGTFAMLLLWAGYSRDASSEARYQPCFSLSLLVMSAAYTCVCSLQPKRRILSWLFLGLTVFLAFGMVLRHHP